MNFNPEFADAVESGDMFACDVCHDFVCYIEDEHGYCPVCHVGACMSCGIALEVTDIGDRDFHAPEYMICKPCFAKDNEINDPAFSIMEQLRWALSRKE